MKKAPINQNIILFALLLLCISSKAQVDLKSFNLFGGSGFYIKGELLDGAIYKFTLSKNINATGDDTSDVSFSLRPMTKDAFIEHFFRSMETFKTKLKTAGSALPNAANLTYNAAFQDEKKSEDYKLLEAEASRLFYIFISGSLVIEDLDYKPMAGEICYSDNIKILRLDYNDNSIKNRIAPSWRFYKKDKRVVRQMLRAGLINENFDLDQEISDPMTPNLSNKDSAQFESLTDSLSGKFSWNQLLEFLDHRKFKRVKRDQYLQLRANSRNKVYQEKREDFENTLNSLKERKEEVKAYEATKSVIDSLVGLENKRNKFNMQIDTILFQEMQSEIIALKSRDVRLRYPPELENLQIDVTNQQRRIEGLVSIKREFEACSEEVSYTECGMATFCKVPLGNLESSLARNKGYFNNELNRTKIEKANIKKRLEVIKGDTSITADQLSRLANDTTLWNTYSEFIKVNITDPIDSILSHTKTIRRLSLEECRLVSEINNVDEQILELTRAISISQVRSQILQAIQFRKEFPELSEGEEAYKLADALKKSTSTKVSELNDSIKNLEVKKSNSLKELALLEDQLIFKEFEVDSIVIEINEGFIENILMIGKVSEYTDKYGNYEIDGNDELTAYTRTLKFENLSPIGFSRKLDFDAIKEKKLYTRGGRRAHYEAYLEDILSIYIQTHKVGRRDYSPANQIVTLTSTEESTALCKPLFKEATYKLFEAKVFSDFVGLDETEPNGLIQTEINKRINLLTSRVPFRTISLGGVRNQWNIGGFSFLEPSLVLSKIEDNNRSLLLERKDRFINNQYAPIRFTSTLRLKQFENFSAGASLNLLLLDMPNLKSTIFANWGFRYGRTAVQDSIRTVVNGVVTIDQNGLDEYGVNTFAHYPEIVWSIYEDERYGLSITWQHHWFYLRDNRFEQVANIPSFQDSELNPEKNVKEFNTIRILTFLEPSSNNRGRLFFRYTYNWQQGFWRTGFHQAQVGYSFYLLGRQAR